MTSPSTLAPDSVTIRRSAADALGGVEGWANTIVTTHRQSESMVVGILSGSRENLDRRVAGLLATSLATESIKCGGDTRTLVVRLDVYVSSTLDRQLSQPPGIPTPRRSPLGPWSDVEIPMPIGKSASWSLTKLPSWLAQWRQQFGLLLVELGPVNQTPGRTLGKLCRSCFIVLGPELCGSAAWLNKHIAWHQSCGTKIEGSLLTRRN